MAATAGGGYKRGLAIFDFLLRFGGHSNHYHGFLCISVLCDSYSHCRQLSRIVTSFLHRETIVRPTCLLAPAYPPYLQHRGGDAYYISDGCDSSNCLPCT
ncbi:unnamed protein product [Brassica napus]|nr:unnamed protein product [Brassica napus]